MDMYGEHRNETPGCRQHEARHFARTAEIPAAERLGHVPSINITLECNNTTVQFSQMLCVNGCVDELSVIVTNEQSVTLKKTVLHLTILRESLIDDKIPFHERRHRNYIQVSFRQVDSKINACIPRLVLIPISAGVPSSDAQRDGAPTLCPQLCAASLQERGSARLNPLIDCPRCRYALPASSHLCPSNDKAGA